jgi:hypothetical protein
MSYSTEHKLCNTQICFHLYHVLHSQILDWVHHKSKQRLVIVAITNKPKFMTSAPRSFQSRFGPSQHSFQAYTPEQVAELLSDRLSNVQATTDATTDATTAPLPYVLLQCCFSCNYTNAKLSMHRDRSQLLQFARFQVAQNHGLRETFHRFDAWCASDRRQDLCMLTRLDRDVQYTFLANQSKFQCAFWRAFGVAHSNDHKMFYMANPTRVFRTSKARVFRMLHWNLAIRCRMTRFFCVLGEFSSALQLSPQVALESFDMTLKDLRSLKLIDLDTLDPVSKRVLTDPVLTTNLDFDRVLAALPK